MTQNNFYIDMKKKKKKKRQRKLIYRDSTRSQRFNSNKQKIKKENKK